MRDEPFFHWQERVLGSLLGWGALSVVVGAGGARSRHEVVRQFAWQAVAWGGIDLLIAALGRRGARRNARVASPTTTERSIARFQRVVAINAALDVGYIFGGSLLVINARGDARRTGVGAGIVTQGIFLAVYDALLLHLSRRWRSPNG